MLCLIIKKIHLSRSNCSACWHCKELYLWPTAGVVFNEMKGVYSQPDSILGRASQQVCFLIVNRFNIEFWRLYDLMTQIVHYKMWLMIFSFSQATLALSCHIRVTNDNLAKYYNTSVQALFPDNTYGVDSGGDPQVIPKLSFQEFKVDCIFLKLVLFLA